MSSAEQFFLYMKSNDFLLTSWFCFVWAWGTSSFLQALYSCVWEGVTCCLKQFCYYVLLPWGGSSLVPLLLKDLATEPKAHLVHRKSADAASRLLLQMFCLNDAAVMRTAISWACTKTLQAFISVCLSSFLCLNYCSKKLKIQWFMSLLVILRSDRSCTCIWEIYREK